MSCRTQARQRRGGDGPALGHPKEDEDQCEEMQTWVNAACPAGARSNIHGLNANEVATEERCEWMQPEPL